MCSYFEIKEPQFFVNYFQFSQKANIIKVARNVQNVVYLDQKDQIRQVDKRIYNPNFQVLFLLPGKGHAEFNSSQFQTACIHEEASGQNFHFLEAPTRLIEVIPNKLLLDGTRVQANFLTKIGY